MKSGLETVSRGKKKEDSRRYSVKEAWSTGCGMVFLVDYQGNQRKGWRKKGRNKKQSRTWFVFGKKYITLNLTDFN